MKSLLRDAWRRQVFVLLSLKSLKQVASALVCMYVEFFTKRINAYSLCMAMVLKMFKIYSSANKGLTPLMLVLHTGIGCFGTATTIKSNDNFIL